MDSGPPLVSVPQDVQEYKEVEKYFWEWCCNPPAEVGGRQVEVKAIQRTVISTRQLEQFRQARAQVRNPYAPLLRLFLAVLTPSPEHGAARNAAAAGAVVWPQLVHGITESKQTKEFDLQARGAGASSGGIMRGVATCSAGAYAS